MSRATLRRSKRELRRKEIHARDIEEVFRAFNEGRRTAMATRAATAPADDTTSDPTLHEVVAEVIKQYVAELKESATAQEARLKAALETKLSVITDEIRDTRLSVNSSLLETAALPARVKRAERKLKSTAAVAFGLLGTAIAVPTTIALGTTALLPVTVIGGIAFLAAGTARCIYDAADASEDTKKDE